jgi:hypothetical protein
MKNEIPTIRMMAPRTIRIALLPLKLLLPEGACVGAITVGVAVVVGARGIDGVSGDRGLEDP